MHLELLKAARVSLTTDEREDWKPEAVSRNQYYRIMEGTER